MYNTSKTLYNKIQNLLNFNTNAKCNKFSTKYNLTE